MRSLRGSGSGLYLPVEGLGLSFQALELPLDEVGQSLPHFQLKAKSKEGTCYTILCCLSHNCNAN